MTNEEKANRFFNTYKDYKQQITELITALQYLDNLDQATIGMMKQMVEIYDDLTFTDNNDYYRRLGEYRSNPVFLFYGNESLVVRS